MRLRVTFSVLAALMLVATSSFASTILQSGPTYIKFDNVEQISQNQEIVAPSGATEINWGVLKLSSISLGDISSNPQNFSPANNGQYWTDSMAGEITGVFAGLTASPDAGPGLLATGGSMYLYYDVNEDGDLASVLPTDRTGDFAVTGFSEGVFLAKIDFMNGAWDIALPNTSVVGTTLPTAGGFTGFANSFGSVDTSMVGLWTDVLDSNYFDTALGANTADLKFRNIYENTGAHTWDDFVSAQNPIFGADSTDPARAYVVPEPSTYILLGTGLLGLIGWNRRRKSK